MIDDATISEVKANNPGLDLQMLECGDDQIIVKTPTEPVYTRFKVMLDDPAQKHQAAKMLTLDCVVHPSREETAALLSKRPGLPDTFCNDLCQMAGLAKGSTRKKL